MSVRFDPEAPAAFEAHLAQVMGRQCACSHGRDQHAAAHDGRLACVAYVHRPHRAVQRAAGSHGVPGLSSEWRLCPCEDWTPSVMDDGRDE